MFDEIFEFIKATEADENDLKQLEHFDRIPSQLVEILKIAVESANGGITSIDFSFSWVLGTNYQEREFLHKLNH